MITIYTSPSASNAIFFLGACQRVHAARPINSNSLAFLVTGDLSLGTLLIFFFLIKHGTLSISFNFSPCTALQYSNAAVYDSKLEPDVSKFYGTVLPSVFL